MQPEPLPRSSWATGACARLPSSAWAAIRPVRARCARRACLLHKWRASPGVNQVCPGRARCPNSDSFQRSVLMRTSTQTIAVILCLAMGACGGTVEPSAEAAGAAGGTGGHAAGPGGDDPVAGPEGTCGSDAGPEATGDVVGGNDAGSEYTCPSDVPSGPCAEAEFPHSCWYGGDPRWFCETKATCFNGQWKVTEPFSACTAPPDPDCPPDLNSGALQCDSDVPDARVCIYGSRYCECRLENGGPELEYRCTPEPDVNCPALPPDEGDSCSGSAACGYDTGCFMQVACVAGRWHWSMVYC